MKAVVDTNVVAYHLMGTPALAEEAMAFLTAADDLLAPAVWEAELANVVWMSVRAGVLQAEDAPAKLALAARLGIYSVASRTLWHGALVRSIESSVAVYDTLFVELADREGMPLVTFDRKLVRTFPALAKRPKEIVSSESPAEVHQRPGNPQR